MRLAYKLPSAAERKIGCRAERPVITFVSCVMTVSKMDEFIRAARQWRRNLRDGCRPHEKLSTRQKYFRRAIEPLMLSGGAGKAPASMKYFKTEITMPYRLIGNGKGCCRPSRRKFTFCVPNPAFEMSPAAAIETSLSALDLRTSARRRHASSAPARATNS